MRRRILTVFALSLLLFTTSRFLQRTPSPAYQQIDKTVSAAKIPSQEISEIKVTESLDEQVVLYKKLIERVGAEEAQEELFRSGMSFDGQTHLLNHTVGDVLYDKYKEAGLRFCKDYFLSSCYHGFVIRAVGSGGVDALIGVMEKCWEKGPHVAMQCSHAIGHGFLAWVGYANLLEALKHCDELSNQSKNFPLYNCHDGAFMENIWAVHESGKPSKDRWLNDNDPIYPCNDPRIPYQYFKACWSNQPMRLYQLFQGDVRRVGLTCLGITDEDHRKTCFDGLARQIHPLTKGSVEETFRLCSFMPEGWIDPCIVSIAKAAFSVGDKNNPFVMCERISQFSKESCYTTLASMVASYTRKNPSERVSLCTRIPYTWQKQCL